MGTLDNKYGISCNRTEIFLKRFMAFQYSLSTFHNYKAFFYETLFTQLLNTITKQNYIFRWFLSRASKSSINVRTISSVNEDRFKPQIKHKYVSYCSIMETCTFVSIMFYFIFLFYLVSAEIPFSFTKNVQDPRSQDPVLEGLLLSTLNKYGKPRCYSVFLKTLLF